MAGRCSLVIAVTLVLVNGLSAAAGASALLHPLGDQTPIVPLLLPILHTPTAPPTLTNTPTHTPAVTSRPMPELIVPL